MNASERYALWMNSPDIDEQTKAELRAIENDPKEIEERFYTELEFGTARLRGILGAGDNRMNIYNVRKATEGLARYLEESVHGQPRVCIAYDSRHCSDLFAKETACVLAAHGVQVFLYSTLHSVPQLSFTVRELKCDAGVVITASHNPPKYNGYKVYGRSAAQSAPDEANAITEKIRTVEGFKTAYKPFDEAVKDGSIKLIGKEIDEIYYGKIMTLLTQPELVKEKGHELKLVYTPLHGSGNVPVREVLKRIGVTNVTVVKEQEAPDGSFPTVTAPNPEDPNAFTLAFRYAEKVGATVIIGTDPDSDRLGLAVKKTDGTWAVLTGNQIGAILIHSLLSSYKATGKLPNNGLIVRSIVSTQLADAISEKFGVELKEVLTGFRFIGEQIAECERTHERTFLFGFEESYGFLAGGFARDKDAICAAMLVAEACVLRLVSRKGQVLHARGQGGHRSDQKRNGAAQKHAARNDRGRKGQKGRGLLKARADRTARLERTPLYDGRRHMDRRAPLRHGAEAEAVSRRACGNGCGGRSEARRIPCRHGRHPYEASGTQIRKGERL